MALKQHLDPTVRFQQQVDNAAKYVLPFVQQTVNLGIHTRVLEIGCGEGGVLKPFLQIGCEVVGVDLNEIRIDLAKGYLQAEVQAGKAVLLCQNVYEEAFLQTYQHQFDLIILKDTIEHIPEQEKFIPYLKNFLKPRGQIYFGFPPWYMPFGGHQQVCKNKLASILPYYHLLPAPVYKFMLKAFGESDVAIEELMEVKETGISIERFERIVHNSGLKVLAKQHFLINPIYYYKFGWKPRKQLGIISALPFFRNFLTTCVYYTVGEK